MSPKHNSTGQYDKDGVRALSKRAHRQNGPTRRILGFQVKSPVLLVVRKATCPYQDFMHSSEAARTQSSDSDEADETDERMK